MLLTRAVVRTTQQKSLINLCESIDKERHRTPSDAIQYCLLNVERLIWLFANKNPAKMEKNWQVGCVAMQVLLSREGTLRILYLAVCSVLTVGTPQLSRVFVLIWSEPPGNGIVKSAIEWRKKMITQSEIFNLVEPRRARGEEKWILLQEPLDGAVSAHCEYLHLHLHLQLLAFSLRFVYTCEHRTINEDLNETIRPLIYERCTSGNNAGCKEPRHRVRIVVHRRPAYNSGDKGDKRTYAVLLTLDINFPKGFSVIFWIKFCARSTRTSPSVPWSAVKCVLAMTHWGVGSNGGHDKT